MSNSIKTDKLKLNPPPKYHRSANKERMSCLMLKKIIPTMRLMDNKKEYDKLIGLYLKCNINTIRFNITRYDIDRYINDIIYISNLYNAQRQQLYIIIDLPYPGNKTRITVNENININAGNDYTFMFSERNDNPEIIKIKDYTHTYNIDDKIILGDGELAFCIIKTGEDYFIAKALNSEVLRNGRAIYIENRFTLPQNRFNEDYSKLIKVINPDFIALSFIEEADDILSIKKIVKQMDLSYEPKIIAKIESPKGVNNLKQILPLINMVMIGRGDLAITTAAAALGLHQNYIINHCKDSKVEVCVATDIINSLVFHYIPTRSDILDLHHILQQGSDHIILSAALSINNNFERAIKFIWEMDQMIISYDNT